MTQILKLSDREFKITLNNTLRTMMEKTDNTQEIGNTIRDMKLEERIKKRLEIKKTVTEIKIAFKAYISRH